MNDLKFTKTKFGTKITRKHSPLKLELKNCKVIYRINKENTKTWNIGISVQDDVRDLIRDIDMKAKSNSETENFLYSNCDGVLKVKIPFRYNKFECEFRDDAGNLIVSSDIIENDYISLNVECSMWSINNVCGLTWQTKLIKKIV